ncbi:ABC transporter permease [Borrelia parkeri]|uniref:ABC transporter permease protein n=1 Tax=Borrelia parkeri SLO TaxID=1313294 RepID=A0ABM5PJ42_BORPR|nr:ABC transporter permease [Borrelia parkeri]AHE63060.1 membrane protein [Borrelia parkeri HR1]AHH09170.1 ABC transporter permease protein [Borrelia parkeri SLO]UPA10882.1 ABC transporter permease subunit [Borrelia parkeri]
MKIDLRQSLALSKKELKVLFGTLTAYVVMLFFLIFVNFSFIFLSGFFIKDNASLMSYFSSMPIILMLVLPALSMGVFSEEHKTGSIELLYALPISPQEIVLGKFITLKIFTLILFALTLPLTIMTIFMGEFDLGIIFLQYLGIILYSYSVLSMGVFISSITRSQIVSYILSVFILIIIVFSGKLVMIFGKDNIFGQILNFISITNHFSYFNMGILNLSDFIYFITFSVTFLMLSSYSIRLKKWR